MNTHDYTTSRRTVDTPYGEIAYVERGSGPTALFVHGVLLNSYLWRDALERLAPERRCIALDIMGHGATRVSDEQDLSFDAQAGMIAAFLDALRLDQVDLVANDSGGGISQIFAANNPQRVRTLTLTNCDTHDNWPPPALAPFEAIVKAGKFLETFQPLADNPEAVRRAFATAYEHPEQLSEETIDAYLTPLIANEESGRCIERFMTSGGNEQTVSIEPKLRRLQAPTLIMWATEDVFFDKKWAYWLKDTIPGAVEVIEVGGAKLFFPEERPEFFADQLRAFWNAHSRVQTTSASAAG